MEYIAVCLVALFASGLTLFSGFGLGTLLLPAFLVFFPVDAAVAMTAVVHLLNNVFKLSLMAKNANLGVVIRFGIPAIVAAYIGAATLLLVADLSPVSTYELAGRTYHVTPVKLLMGMLIAGFAVLEALPSTRKVQFSGKHLLLGGFLSGFFGGISGHQGALRSAFLVRAGLSTDAFIATGVVVACLVDVTRISVYTEHFTTSGIGDHASLLGAATLSAFLGVFIGSRLLARITMRTIQRIVSLLLLLVAIGLGLGIL